MKKLLFIFAAALASCTPSENETKAICDCKVVVFVNDVPNGTNWNYSKDCKDDGKVIEKYMESGYVVEKIVKCK